MSTCSNRLFSSEYVVCLSAFNEYVVMIVRVNGITCVLRVWTLFSSVKGCEMPFFGSDCGALSDPLLLVSDHQPAYAVFLVLSPINTLELLIWQMSWRDMPQIWSYATTTQTNLNLSEAKGITYTIFVLFTVQISSANIHRVKVM